MYFFLYCSNKSEGQCDEFLKNQERLDTLEWFFNAFWEKWGTVSWFLLQFKSNHGYEGQSVVLYEHWNSVELFFVLRKLKLGEGV